MAKAKKRSWRGERAHKFTKSDKGKRPKPGTSKKYWRRGYTRKDGTRVKGGWVKNPNYKGR